MTMTRLMRDACGLVLAVLCFACGAMGQTETATVSGLITDDSGAVVPGAEVKMQSVERGTVGISTTNNAGIYVFASVHPGQYQLTVQRPGFKQVDFLGLIVNVQDHIEQNFRLQVGSVAESVTVQASSVYVNTTDGSVGTVIDRRFVENMPLNGRSFQDLILLTPGVVTNSPQTPANIGISGEFSVNGQRTESNYYTVDGVSANVGISGNGPYAPSTTGALPASTALGTTQGLVSVDALEEFRVQSSSYSAEFGRSPGGQFSFVTRSGANKWHGAAFDYLRNDFFDANNWFNDFFRQAQAPLRQNDFGGTLGGPIRIPGIYNGKDKTFFFFSYEGLRLLQPQPSSLSHVPTAGPTGLRTSAPAGIQPVLNAFPLPFCPTSASPTSCTTDSGNGIGDFVGTWSNPSSIDSYSIRFDQVIKQRLRFFFRFSDTESTIQTRSGGANFNPAVSTAGGYAIRTYTGGLTSSISPRVNDEVRVNYTSNANTSSSIPDAFGGATPVDLVRLQGFDSQSGRFAAINIALAYDSFFPNVLQSRQEGVQKQWNIVNTLGQSLGRHHLKYGIDYRRLTPENHVISPVAVYDYFSEDSVRANSVDLGIGTSTSPAFPIYTNFSAFAQDEWRVKSRLSLALGLRWEVNPAPGAPKGNLPFTLQGDIGNPSSLKLAPQGTPLWKTAWFNFAPRLGAAYILRNDPSTETVVRGGVGVFFDTGQQNGSWGYQGPGFSALTFFGGLFGSPASFPVAPAQVAPTIVSPPVAPYSVPVYASPTHLQLPFTLQWNASIQQALGNSRALTLSYVGANARRLLQQKEFSIQQAVNPDISTVVLYTNGLTSDYNAFQIQLQQRVDRGLQVLASYTFAHALDYGSQDTAFHYVRGNSDFDVRHTFSAALMYDVPHRFSNHLAQALLHHWGFDDRFTARTGFPVSLQGQQLTDPATGQQSFAGLNVVPGASLYIQGPQFPGGRSINPAAFSRPSAGQFGDAPRNFVRGFGAWQMDFAIRRDFPLYESLKLQFRAEAFNIFNHPNFGSINARCGGTPGTPGCTNPQFGQATATLAQSLGGLSPLYQVGGPRSLQFALKLIF